MSLPYAYTPYIWPMLASAVFLSGLGFYSWRQRHMPGARPFALMLLFTTLWSLGAALELATTDLTAKVFWFKFLSAMRLPVACAEFCFGLQYAGLGRFLTRRNLVLLSIPPILVFILILTNDLHHLLWLGFKWDGVFLPLRTPLTYAIAGFALLLGIGIFVIFLSLFIRSPRHRWPVILILAEVVIARTAVIFEYSGVNPFSPMDPVVLAWNAGAVLFAIALFGFRMFDPIPLARTMVAEQMREGMLVLDTSGKLVDLNPAAETILGLPAARARGRSAADILPAYAEASSAKECKEICLRTDGILHHYELSVSPLKDHSDALLGHLLLLHDVTEQKQTQSQILEQQKALATWKEREQVARELHDELAQELALINVQAQVVSALLEAGQAEQARDQLQLLARVARETHMDVRGQIRELSLNITQEEGFFGTLRHFLDMFQQMYAIETELVLPGDGAQISLDPTVELQLLRIVQEAFTNVRKHAQATHVRIVLVREPGCVELTVEDDGAGFDPDSLPSATQTFGLGIMSERAREINGSVAIHSTPGQGTWVAVTIPVNGEQ